LKIISYIAILLLFASCEYFAPKTTQVPVARVNDSYLYEDDIKQLISDNASVEDSTLIVNNFINRWATQQLLMDQARINLSGETLSTYENLVQQYKNDLYSEAYKNSIIAQQLDTTVSDREMEDFYELNRENFKLKDPLVKVRFITVDPSFANVNEFKLKLDRYNEADREFLIDATLQFKSHNFNDSIWVKNESLLEALPILKTKKDQVIKKSNFSHLQDSLGVYLVKIKDLLQPNDITPLSHLKPTIKEIILNKRKQELIKELEKDITRDAIENKTFETYTTH